MVISHILCGVPPSFSELIHVRCIRLILAVDEDDVILWSWPLIFLDLGFMYLRSIYWDSLSFVKGTFGSWALGIIKYFCKTLRSFVECLVWRLESLILSSILVDLCISNTFAGCHPLGEGSNLGRCAIVTELHSIPSSRHWVKEYLYCVLQACGHLDVLWFIFLHHFIYLFANQFSLQISFAGGGSAWHLEGISDFNWRGIENSHNWSER